MRRRPSDNAWALGAVSLLFLAGACAPMGPDYSPPELSTPDAWRGQPEGGLTTNELDPASLARWWEGLEDPVLSQLIEDAIQANLDLRTAEAQVRQARAQRALAQGEQFPTLKLASGSFDASWELDVFGGKRRAVEAAGADEQAAIESRRDVLVSVLAEVAINYVELRTFQKRLAIAQRNLETQEETLKIVRAQLDRGAATGMALEQAIANAASTRSEIPSFAKNVSQAKNRLTLLLGEPPGARDEQLDRTGALPIPPIEVGVGVPADVLRRRPDIRRAERLLAAETARVGVAAAEIYPKLALNGSIGVETLSGRSPIRADITWTLFDAGRTRSKIQIQDAIQEQALIAYEAAILGALEDVENALTAFAEEQLRLQALRDSAGAAERASALASKRYEAGAAPFLEVLDSQRTALSAQDRVAASEGEIVSNLIRLYKGLGGGWSPIEPGPANP